MTTAHPAVGRADGLLGLGRYEEAAALLGGHLAEYPDDARAWLLLGRARHALQRHREALDACDEALGADPQYVDALILRGTVLRHVDGRFEEAEEALRAAVRLAPHHWYPYARLADLVFRARLVRRGQARGGQLEARDLTELAAEPAALAREALRLGPEEVYAHEVAQLIARLSGDAAAADALDRAILRLDPQHPEALARRTRKVASAAGVRAAEAAALYADALAVTPGSAAMRQGLDHASYRLLRGTRWLALLCVALAGAGVGLFSSDTSRALPLSPGQRLWDLVPMAVIWGVGALLRYRGLRAGVRINLVSLVRRRPWPRIVLGQAAWAMVCALLLTQVPWTERTVPEFLFWAGLLPTFVTLWFDRKTG
ncbi:tetratricopeptide repeat protein [Streptomyces sp. NPDC059631]|uniref:tetratricopeptide repeat protein n=1 Tax=unclassified Streptomyces TaxID=2593676 RepID=UPI00367589F0